jgi:hypothetical protein
LEVQKHEVRACLRLPPYGKAPVKARSARKFTQTDLVFFVLIAQLHIELGMSPRAIGKASGALYSLVTSRLEPHKSILINIHRGTATYLSGSVPSESGVVLMVAPAIERVQNYLLGELPPVGSADRNVVRLDRRTKA